MAKKRKTKNINKIITAVLLAVIIIVSVIINNGEKFGVPNWNDIFVSSNLTTAKQTNCDGLTLSFIDVGQGDSTLLYAENMAVLIDGGEKEYGETIINELSSIGIEKLDLLIATHPHSDHIGALPYVLDNIKCDKVIMPKLPENLVPVTAVYKNFLTAVKNNGANASYAYVNDEFVFDDIRLTILGPITYKSDLNNSSLVVRIDYGETSFLIGGDEEQAVEKEIIKAGIDVDVDLLHCGHHGSKYSTCDEFLNAVSPKYAIISVGEGNSYGHPHEETLVRLNNYNVKFYRTDLDGTIICNSDGKTISFKER